MTMLTHFYSRINFALNRLGNAADQKRSVARVVICWPLLHRVYRVAGFSFGGLGRQPYCLNLSI